MCYISTFILITLLAFVSKDFLNIFIDKKVHAVAPKNILVCVPFIGKKLLQLRFKLVKSIQNNNKFLPPEGCFPVTIQILYIITI